MNTVAEAALQVQGVAGPPGRAPRGGRRHVGALMDGSAMLLVADRGGDPLDGNGLSL